MTNSQIRQFYELMSQTTSIGRENIRSLYLDVIGEKNIPFCIEYYKSSKDAKFRADLIQFLIRYSRISEDVIQLALVALSDRAKGVRRNACAVLAYSLRDDLIAKLDVLSSHKDEQTREKANAAILAIKTKNIDEFVKPIYDKWVVTLDRNIGAPMSDIDHYIRKNNPKLVEPIESIIGSIYPTNKS